ncbi:MAG: hypothetical protein IT378_08895 [Sandaracinaceae bacterium]|nr:hypothetical protein [Sandaracinaceae bacterium]
MRRASTAGLCVCLGMGCSSGPPPAPVGSGCEVDDDCASGQCLSYESARLCTTECSPESPCPVAGTRRLACGGEGLCVLACTDGTTSGSGAQTRLCVDGLFVDCAGLDPAMACTACGCGPFGGGRCTTGGCVLPQPDGTSCTLDVECASGACYRDSQTCGSPRAMGEPCRVDAECADRNCSTDGDQTATGVCNQPLGSACRGAGGSATCTRCIVGPFSISGDGFCSRAFCDPVDANHCPTSGRRVWGCAESVDGRHRCYETCYEGEEYPTYSCLDPIDSCRNGYCS